MDLMLIAPEVDALPAVLSGPVPLMYPMQYIQYMVKTIMPDQE